METTPSTEISPRIDLNLDTRIWPDKDLTFVKGDQFQHMSAEELLGKKLNAWRGWYCTAGRDSLTIKSSGNVFKATCGVDGMLGNVFEGPISPPAEKTICKKDFCSCGADMILKKARTKELFEKGFRSTDVIEATEPIASPDYVLPYPLNYHNQYQITIAWDLGRRCNLSCSYCNPFISNNYESHKSYGTLKSAVDNVWNYFSFERKIKWVMTGGEPTLNPHYKELVKYIRSRGDQVHTQSNGTNRPEYYADLIEDSFLGFSAHLEQMKPELFIRNCEAVIDRKRTFAEPHAYWFGIRIMVPPGYSEKAIDLHDRLQSIPDFKTHADLRMSVVYEPLDSNILQKYDPEEMSKIQKYL